MMKKIAIISTPNQSFTTTINDTRYDFLFRSNDGFMTYDLSINEEYVVRGFRFVYGNLLLPYKYQEVDGNFYLDMPSDETPDYNNFGNSQNLLYVTADELKELRSGN